MPAGVLVLDKNEASQIMNKIPISTLIHNGPERRSEDEVQRLKIFGRDYYKWGNWVYPFPCDDDQGELWDVLHDLIYEAALNNRLHTTQLRSSSTSLRVTDIGYGTGKWTLSMANQYPDSQIIGFDLVPFQIRHSFRNLNNVSPVDFTREEWPLKHDSQDLIHLAMLCGSVPSWEKLYQTAFKYITPGTGQIEHIEIDWEPRSHPARFPSEARLLEQWWACLKEASSYSGYPMACPSAESTEQYLEDAGFVDIVRRKIRIPFHLNEKDEYEWKMSHHYKGATISDGPVDKNAFASLSMLHLTKELGFSPEDVKEMCRQLTPVVNRRYTPLYNNLYVWTARKPISPTSIYQNGNGEILEQGDDLPHG